MYQPLDPRLVPLQRVVLAIVSTIVASASFTFLVGAWIVRWFAGSASLQAGVLGLLAWMALVLLLAWSAYRWPEISYRHASYRADAVGVEIRRGVVWRTIISVPRSRVQHLDVSQGPLERRHGLATLVMYTAGTQHAKVDLSGLDHARAVEIREHLLPTEPAASDAV